MKTVANLVGIAAAIRRLCMFAGPFLAYNLAGRVAPVLAGYKITNKCNLTCTHCPFWKRSGEEQDFQGVLATLQRLAALGVRILILEGGEPLLWRDGARNFRHVLEAAQRIFPCVCMTTNGTLPWGDLPLDRVWVSLDGPPSVHDEIRGNRVAEKVLANLEDHGKGRAYVSTTISRVNFHSIPDMIRMLRGLVQGVTIQFYYPYQGLPDPFFVPSSDRTPLLEEIIHLKKDGFPVANSVDSLSEMKKERWSCESGLLANAEPDGSIHRGCYLKNRGEAECSRCGFTAHNEMSLAFRGRLGSISAGMNIFFGIHSVTSGRRLSLQGQRSNLRL
ncbi:MAG TPA: radical SAM protein [Desulfomonilaceae bacterium]|nr:radical SAM protein [Desulfomonilaceae bacterium]